jgi:acyl carrier protein
MKMKKDEIFQEVLNTVKPYVKNGTALENATSSTRFIEDLKINSARLVDIVIDFEDKFNFAISDEEAEQIQSMGSAVDLIEKLLNASTKK